MTQRYPLQSTRRRALLFRVAGHGALATIAILIPAVGPNRFWLAAVLVFVTAPVAVLLSLYIKEQSRNWVEALLDLLLVVSLVHLVPDMWLPAMCLGLMVALAPSVSLHRASHWIYLGFGVVLVLGMTLAALRQGPDNWQLAIAAIAVTYPSMLYYTYTQMQRSRALQQGKQSVQSMVQMAGSVAHDFNNMLTGISGYAELALIELPSDHPARQDMLEVLNGTERASLLCGQLLSFAGRGTNQTQQIDVAEEVRVIVGLLKPALPAGTSVTLEMPDEPLFIEAQLSQLHQALMNVLLNAGEAMLDTHEPLAVVLTRAQPAVDVARLELTITDRGIGIPESVLPNIFERFYTTKADGHGLGLAATKDIMEILGGDIQVRAAEGGGTAVTLSWPESTAPARNSRYATTALNRSALARPDRRSNGTVLVVDDNPEVRAVATGILKGLNYQVVSAGNAEEAINQFRKDHQQIDAVLLDLKMPGQNGWACLKALRSICQDTEVIICSGYNPSETLSDYTVNDPHLKFLRKPYRSEHLAAALLTSDALQV